MTDERPVAVALENRLMSHGIYLLDFEWVTADEDPETNGDESATADSTHARPQDGVDIRIEYETVAEVETVTSDEVGAVVRTVLEIADEREWTPGRFEASSLTTEGNPRGRWHVKSSWFDRLHEDLTELEFSQCVLNTVTNKHEN